ncbi:LysR family transcriptional regulator [Tardiphaga robiniae]|uniref:LysR family transcriptional regulator n=1 Tax=Tardiphaga robiniae TaxID=943830 RepID=A0A7G6U924_9BRAD|nr:LysR family transcriptional regulator [Tardiphaga robiniae]QND75506.1 LysR family transcriptional regulator [Tardiphaga robiniae]
MLDGVSLDQLRTFLAAVEEGSFSAAGRKLGRAQSVVSQTLASLEGQLGVQLFARTGHKPVLTDQGRALIEYARSVAMSIDLFKAKAKGMAEGLEAELAIVVDVMFPIERLTTSIIAYRDMFPDTPLRIYVEALGAVLQPLIDRRCTVGVMGSLPTAPEGMATEPLSREEIAMVASPDHPLARRGEPLTTAMLAEHTQLVLTDRSTLSEGRQFGVMSSKVWHLADLGAKLAFLRAGLGYGAMPLAMIRADLEAGTLVRLELADIAAPLIIPMLVVYRLDAPPGPAGRWLIERLKEPGGAM